MNVIKKFLISALLFSFNGWADDGLPIEITCEKDDEIVYFYISKYSKDSWWRYFRDPINKKRKFRREHYIWDDKDDIALDSIVLVPGFDKYVKNLPFQINRLTGKYRFVDSQGECFKGFKEYKERKF